MVTPEVEQPSTSPNPDTSTPVAADALPWPDVTRKAVASLVTALRSVGRYIHWREESEYVSFDQHCAEALAILDKS